MEDWSKYIEDDESWDTIYLDFSKAFESVAHKRLLHKKTAFGIRGSVLSWIQDFLTGRRQYVSVKGGSSFMERCFKWGTPGQCHGAYLIYIIYK